MKLKTLLLWTIIIGYVQSCKSQDCPEKINQLPMYGNLKKCDEQLKADQSFIKAMDSLYKTRGEASLALAKRGWDYYYKLDTTTAMARFNQAWLLDSTNYQTYWGFANLYGQKDDINNAIKFFALAKKYHPTNSNFYVSSASANEQVFQQNNDIKVLKLIIDDLETAVKLDKSNATAYAQLGLSYYFNNEKAKAKEYLTIAEKLDPNMVDPKVKELINGR